MSGKRAYDRTTVEIGGATYAATVEQSANGTWLWIGSIATYHPDGRLRSSVCRWGAPGLTEDAARAAASKWLDSYRDNGGHAIPGLSDVGDPLAYLAAKRAGGES